GASMDFFAQQARVRGSSRRLVGLFILAVVAIVVAIDVVVLVALGALVVGWAFALWGTGLYWWAGILYVRQTVDLLRSVPPVAKEQRPVGPPHEGPTPRPAEPLDRHRRQPEARR
ncbi:MAG: hypothetical protein L0H26_12365, partial [Microlunatus sp.]|nr:hypothetical protein [Microlunatus sp.]